MAAPHCPAQGKCFLLGRAVAVGITDSRGFLAFLQELQKALGAFVVFTLLKEHGVLLDFTVEILRDDIAGTRNELTVLEALRKRNEAGLSIAGLHKLIGLADVVAQNGLAFNRFFQAEGLQRLVGSFAVSFGFAMATCLTLAELSTAATSFFTRLASDDQSTSLPTA